MVVAAGGTVFPGTGGTQLLNGNGRRCCSLGSVDTDNITRSRCCVASRQLPGQAGGNIVDVCGQCVKEILRAAQGDRPLVPGRQGADGFQADLLYPIRLRCAAEQGAPLGCRRGDAEGYVGAGNRSGNAGDDQCIVVHGDQVVARDRKLACQNRRQVGQGLRIRGLDVRIKQRIGRVFRGAGDIDIDGPGFAHGRTAAEPDRGAAGRGGCAGHGPGRGHGYGGGDGPTIGPADDDGRTGPGGGIAGEAVDVVSKKLGKLIEGLGGGIKGMGRGLGGGEGNGPGLTGPAGAGGEGDVLPRRHAGDHLRCDGIGDVERSRAASDHNDGTAVGNGGIGGAAGQAGAIECAGQGRGKLFRGHGTGDVVGNGPINRATGRVCQGDGPALANGR